MTDVSSDKSRSLPKGDTCDQEVGPADAFEILDSSEPVEFGCGRPVKADHRPPGDILLDPVQPELRRSSWIPSLALSTKS